VAVLSEVSRVSPDCIGRLRVESLTLSTHHCLLPAFVAYAAAMSNLQSQLENLASEFINSLIGALRSAPIDEIIELQGAADAAAPSAPRRRGAAPKAQTRRAAPATAKPTGRRHRASAVEVQAQKKLALDTAKTLKPGFSKGEAMAKAGSKVDLGRALTLLVQEGKLRKQGERRMTRYWVK
jgi:hypothetical protein